MEPFAGAVVDEVLAGGGEMGTLMRGFDWPSTPLGPVSTWPQSLRTVVGILLTTRHPMLLWWGPDLIQFYNDAYRQSLGPDRHPSALGQPGRECWAEAWDTMGPQIEAVLERGEATWHEDHLVPIVRGGRLEDAWWSYSYSPVRNDGAGIGGVLVTMQETTPRILAERRLRILRELAERETAARTEGEACGIAVSVLAGHAADLPFARLYLREPGGRLTAAGQTGTVPETLARAQVMVPDAGTGSWPLESVLRDVGPVVINALGGETVHQALILPIPVREAPVDGVLVAGIPPRIPLDQEQRNFVASIATQIGRSVGSARAHDGARRRAETLNVELSRLASLFEQSPGFLAVLSGPEHRFELINRAFSQLIGHRQVRGRSAREAMPEVEGQGFFELLDRVYRTGEPFVGNELPMNLQRASDAPLQQHFFSFVYQPMRDASGNVWGVLATGHDVTAQVHSRQAADRLAAERDAEHRQLVTVLEQSPIAILIREAPSGRLLYANRRVTEVYGSDAPPERFSAYSEHYQGFDQDGRPLAPEEWPLARAIQRGEVIELQTMRVEHEGGHRAEISVNAAPVRDQTGRIVAGVAFFREVSAERRREHQLHDAQRLQSVGTLAGGVAHEINNQMTVVLSFGELILEALGQDHPQAADMRVVVQAGRRAARVSQQLLAFTRRQVSQPRDVVLPVLTAELLPVLRQLLGRDKTLELVPSPSEWHVHADPTQIEQVLINLIANARDATPTGGRVSVRVEDVVYSGSTANERGYSIPAGDYVVLTVADTGRGMDQATLARAFEPFYTTKAVGEGSGLGLSMVYGIVKQHHGFIEAESEPGQETVFRIYLPSVAHGAAATVGEQAPSAARVGPAGAAATHPPVTVLVVDDEVPVQTLVVRTLSKVGYTALGASDGAEALELLRHHPEVEVVLTDVVMPNLNGRQLYDALLELRPDLRVLFMSGHTADAAVLRELVPPGAPFLQKPFTIAELSEAVAAVVARRQ
jgi:signal transduction histidine kinase/ActR/RegA family two-component response regulator